MTTFCRLLACCATLWMMICMREHAQGEERWTATETEPLLTAPILDANQALADVQQFARRRVAKMPALDRVNNGGVTNWADYAEALRSQILEQVVFRGETLHWRQQPLRFEYFDELPGDGYRIRKLRYEALPGVWIPALLYEPQDLTTPGAAMLAVNGHDADGKAAAYKQLRCANLARHGMVVLNVEWFGMGQLRDEGLDHYRAVQVELAGTPAVSMFFLAMQRGLDVLLQHEAVDPQRVAVSGVSGGGWQTIFLSSLDPRIALANPVAGYSSFFTRIDHLSDLGDTEQTPTDLAALADYKHLTAIMAPRPTLLTYNAADQCCFRADHVLAPLVEAAEPIFALHEAAENLATHINTDPGTHNFELDNRQALYRFVGEHFFPQREVDWNIELAGAEDVHSADELQVPLPGGRRDFQRIALDLTQNLPRQVPWPTEADALSARLERERRLLQQIVQWPDDSSVVAVPVGEDVFTGVHVQRYKLRVAGEWTLPAVVLTPDDPRQNGSQGTVLVVADGGRGAAAEHVARCLEAGQRVVALDPFYFGEAAVAERDYLFALLISSVGERPLGIQAAQVAAVARWCDEQAWGLVSVVSVGPRTGTIVLVAAAVDAEAIATIELYEAFASLRDPIQANESAHTMPEQFCFGLLAAFDLAEIACLVAPRPLTWHCTNEPPRVASVRGVYRTLAGSDAALAIQRLAADE